MPNTLPEGRYVCFAPVTQGAMGIFGWRLARCTQAYREAVVYPVMREIKRFVPWFLGEWHDERVTSDHDTPSVEYPTQFPERIRLVEGLEDAKIVKVPGVPDCSYCLRRRTDDGSYLLLAVNNRKESITVTFTLADLPNLPLDVQESLEYRKVELKGNTLRDNFGPFDVHAYVFTAAAPGRK